MAQLNPEGAIAAKLAGETAGWRRARANTVVDQTDHGFGAAYAGAGRKGAIFGDWPAYLGSADRDWLPSRGGVTARARDMFRNDPIAPSAVARRKNAAVGKGWRLSSKPNARALGVTPAEARELGQQIESEWRQYAYGHNFSVDAERRMNFGQLLRVAASHLMLDGEFLAVVEYADDEPTRYKTRLRLIDPDRLSNPMGRVDSDTLRGGVEMNRAGVPIRYWIRERHPFDIGYSALSYTWNPWERFATPLGRPQVLHGFDADRAGQHRGISRFASALKEFRGFSRFKDATIQSAAINALLLGYVQSSAGPEAISEYFTAQDLAAHEEDREGFYNDQPVKLGDSVFMNLPLGDEVKFLTAQKDVTSFDGFARSIIRLIAASLGVTYEELSMDYSQTNYSSARAAMVHAWAETVAFMGVLEAQLVKPFYVAFLEEMFDSGFVAVNDNWPDFYGAEDAYAEGRWIGPPKGFIDPTKEILAAAARIEAGVSTLEDECAEQGKDYHEVIEQQAYELQLRRDAGLEPEIAAIAQAIEDTKNPAKQASDPSDDSGQPAPEDQRPADTQPKPGQGARARTPRPALSRIAGFADTQEHADFLDRRPEAAAA